MKISVIIPTYNRLEKLSHAIQSVLEQSYSEFEIIVVDDGSTDETKNVYKNNQNLRYVYQNNHGVASARNLGIAHAKYQWIAFLDSDDQWHKDKLQRQVDYHNSNPLVLISQTEELWIRNGKQLKAIDKYQLCRNGTYEASLKQCVIGASTVIIHQSIFDDIGNFNESFEVCEDYELWLRISAKYDVGLLREALITKYGGDDDQLSTKYWGMDRWRVRALEIQLNNKIHLEKVIPIIKKKCTILLKGAVKHNNKLLIPYCESLLRQIDEISV